MRNFDLWFMLDEKHFFFFKLIDRFLTKISQLPLGFTCTHSISNSIVKMSTYTCNDIIMKMRVHNFISWKWAHYIPQLCDILEILHLEVDSLLFLIFLSDQQITTMIYDLFVRLESSVLPLILVNLVANKIIPWWSHQTVVNLPIAFCGLMQDLCDIPTTLKGVTNCHFLCSPHYITTKMEWQFVPPFWSIPM